jgi:predicted ATP-binding protein involved in virulence/polyhydroxyalkanoate synthesis regulator phasin
MELVYLWVEEYKNIEKQGFNFSPRFECKFENDTLTIIEKDEDKYIDNFFGDNINVTAIVGKNGSGKSSVLEFILDRLAKKDNTYPENFIFLYSYKNELYKYSNFKYEISSTLSIKEYQNIDNLIKYYKDTIAININSEYKEIEVRDTYQIFSENNKYDKNSNNLVILENYINHKEQVNKIKEKFFIPNKIKISIKTIGFDESILTDNRDYYSDEDWKKISILIDTLKDKNFNESLKIINNIFKLKKEKHKNYDSENHLMIGIFDDRKNPNQYSFNEELLTQENIPEVLDEYKLKQTIDITSIDNNCLEYLKKLPYVFEVDLVDKNDINIDSLSFGEKQLLMQLHYILKHSFKKEYQLYHPPSAIRDENGNEIWDDEYEEDVNINNAFIFLDEFEIGLHPQWQKKTINYIVGFLKELTNINFHIILTTHSPFLLSDIPKQNIIFLDTDEEGKCKVVDGLKEKKQTFGANIHTLLNDSFFMENGLMGEFAKGKIDEAFDLLTKTTITKEKQKYCEEIISIIGEPIIKRQLQKMLDSKRLSKIDKIDELQQQIETLQQQVEELQTDA